MDHALGMPYQRLSTCDDLFSYERVVVKSFHQRVPNGLIEGEANVFYFESKEFVS
jgi:hypothetical protein